MIRLVNWPETFANFIEARRFMAFEWGTHDCALFPADGVLAMTGVDLAAAFRGTYKTERGALLKVKRAGGMREIVLAAGLTEKHPGLAQRGDVTLVDTAGWATLGLNAGNGHWCAPGPAGLVFRPLSEVQLVFAV